MKKIFIILLLALAMISGCKNIVVYSQDPVNIYFCGGQSNATFTWYSTIKEEILKIDNSAIVLHNRHPDASIREWFYKYPREDYTEDLSIILDGIKYHNNYDLKAIFWFQGESDHHDGLHETYEKSFTNLFELMGNDIEDIDFDIMTTLVYSTKYSTDSIRNVQSNMIVNYPNIYGIDSKYYERTDRIHLSIDAYKNLAKDTVELYLSYK